MISSLTSCALNLKPIKSDFILNKFDEDHIELDKLGNGKIMIYNGADILHQVTGRLNIWINNKPLGQFKLKEYVIINLNNGIYDLKVQHFDLVNMRSSHKVEITENTRVIRIEPTVFSNKVSMTNELPKKIEEYRLIEDK